MCLPLFSALASLLPDLAPLCTRVERSIAMWQDLKAEAADGAARQRRRRESMSAVASGGRTSPEAGRQLPQQQIGRG